MSKSILPRIKVGEEKMVSCANEVGCDVGSGLCPTWESPGNNPCCVIFWESAVEKVSKKTWGLDDRVPFKRGD